MGQGTEHGAEGRAQEVDKHLIIWARQRDPAVAEDGSDDPRAQIPDPPANMGV